jgi:hypothetical protein
VLRRFLGLIQASPEGSFNSVFKRLIPSRRSDFLEADIGRYPSCDKMKEQVVRKDRRIAKGCGVTAPPRFFFLSLAWTAKEVHKYDLAAGSDASVLKLSFMPDNLTWNAKEQILAAGIKGVQGDCPAGSAEPCIQEFEVAVIDPGKMQAKTVYDSHGKGALISGTSVALQLKDSIFVGSFQGNRILRLKANPVSLSDKR